MKNICFLLILSLLLFACNSEIDKCLENHSQEVCLHTLAR